MVKYYKLADIRYTIEKLIGDRSNNLKYISVDKIKYNLQFQP